jgi:soluble lytic murein transglycosylase-like protein
MKALAEIESSNNPKAYNKRTQARGLYQITPVVFRQFKEHDPQNPFTIQALFEPNMAKFVADWYLDWLAQRCDTVDEILIAWNWGYGHWRKWANKGGNMDALPKETRDFLEKYHRLTDDQT